MTKLSTEEARGATNNAMPRHVLVVGTGLAIIAMVATLVVFLT